ncbi:MAG: hypothetical protein JF588_22155 [Caulobacterales bacterium]|nr:hypothetical protein [Caulobacterales bacterium]
MTGSDDGSESSEKLAALASAYEPLSFLERSFVLAACALALPDPASVERSETGYLIFRWDTPVSEIGSLWASIIPEEVVLSTRTSHQHFGRTHFFPKRLSGRKLELRIAHDSAEQTASVLRGEVCDTTSYDAGGQRHSNGWVPTDRLAEALAYSRKVFGEGMTMRAWNWFGEVAV